MDRNFIKFVIKEESNFNPNSVSSAGGIELMQLVAINDKYYKASNPYDVNPSIDAGTRLLKDYINM